MKTNKTFEKATLNKKKINVTLNANSLNFATGKF